MDNLNDDTFVIHLPADGYDMINLLISTMGDMIKAGESAESVLESVHSYSCYWLEANDIRASQEEDVDDSEPTAGTVH